MNGQPQQFDLQGGQIYRVVREGSALTGGR